MRPKPISGFSRREVINRALTLAAAGLTVPYAGPVSAAPRLCCSPFTLGVASGDPYPDGVVLWTRLAIDLEDGEQWGLPERAYTLRWEVRDPGLSGTPLVKYGTAIASADKAYAVHVEVTGLQPGRNYLYRFILGDYFDEGVTRTAPARGAMPESLRFAFCSCAEFENAYHYAYKFMADEKPEFIVHLGDYIYEQTYDEHYQYDSNRGSKKEKDKEKDPPASRSECPDGGAQVQRTRKLQFDRAGKLRELSQYRRRYAEYKLKSPELRYAHKQCPFIVTWDDHEVDNDYAGERSAESEETGFVQRRMNAYRAYFENLPLRLSGLPQQGGGRRLYRHFDFGGLMRLHMLDERQYRSPQACPKSKLEGKGRFVALKDTCMGQITDAVDARGHRREMLGKEQEQWLEAQLAGSEARWNVLAQGVMMAHVDLRADCQFKSVQEKAHVFTDSWSGYIAARQRIIDLMDRYGAKNPIVLGGDVHCHFANTILKDWADPRSQAVAPEFVCTAISSFTRDYSPLAGPDRGNEGTIVGVHGKRNGYVVCDVGKDEFRVAMAEVDAKLDTIGDRPTDVHRYVVHAGKHTPEVA